MADVCRRVRHCRGAWPGAGWEDIVKQLAGETGAVFVSPLVRFEAVHGLARKKATAGSGEKKPSPDMLFQARAAVDEFISGIGAEEVEISAAIGALAIDAGMSYGKAVGHPAALNFGDCFSYACAKALGTGLAYKGGDFARTDPA